MAKRNPLDLVTLRQLRYFDAAMRARSFNDAARERAVSQPALSEQISGLESTLGLRLFDREHRRATPTQPAQQFHRQITACLSELQAVLQGAQEGTEQIAGEVRIGLVQSYGSCWVVPVVQRMLAQWPQVTITMRRRTAASLVEAVLRGDIDMAVGFDVLPQQGVELLPCFVEPFVAVGRLPARLRSFDLKRLAREPLALLPGDYTMRRQIDAAFAAARLSPKVVFESDVLDDLVQVARANGLVAILNASAVLSLGVNNAVPIAVPGLQRTACMLRASSRYQTRAASHLWEALVACAPKLPARWHVSR